MQDIQRVLRALHSVCMGKLIPKWFSAISLVQLSARFITTFPCLFNARS